jgi:hypothetical protein
MAAADYRLCDVCGRKTFYDANLNYEWDDKGEMRLDSLGTWSVICEDCAKTHKTAVVPPDSVVVSRAVLEQVRAAMREAGHSIEHSYHCMGPRNPTDPRDCTCGATVRAIQLRDALAAIKGVLTTSNERQAP